jgi:hypothetical protein
MERSDAVVLLNDFINNSINNNNKSIGNQIIHTYLEDKGIAKDRIDSFIEVITSLPEYIIKQSYLLCVYKARDYIRCKYNIFTLIDKNNNVLLYF